MALCMKNNSLYVSRHSFCVAERHIDATINQPAESLTAVVDIFPGHKTDFFFPLIT